MAKSTAQQDSAAFTAALSKYNINLSEDLIPKLADYCHELWSWNQRLNLTRHTDFDTFVARDLVDTLQLSRHIPNGASVLDVGSGGGVPGLVLTIIRPDLRLALAESVGKKARALQAMTTSLKLPVPVHGLRAEDVLKTHSFDLLTVRAVASLRKLLFWLQRPASAFQSMLLVKGPKWKAERDEAMEAGLMESVNLQVVDEYRVPGHDNDSVILSVSFDS